MRIFWLNILVLISVVINGQTDISGVINSYYSVQNLQVTTATLTLDNTTGISVGDTLLFMQMQGALIDRSNSNSYGEVDDYLGAGEFEWVEICEINGAQVVLKKHLKKTYYGGGSIQLISCPTYNDVNVTSELTCDPWDGSKGGVLLLTVNGNVTMQSNMDVSKKGFRGGQFIEATNTCTWASAYNDYVYEESTTLGGMKGEGVALYDNKNLGRGPLANGGGGGNDHNSGGAGGSNVTKGGDGGENKEPGQWKCKGKYPGVGGIPLDHTGNRLFLGGGGGAGHSNNGMLPYNGGNGGGIVMILANQITANGNKILSNGGDGLYNVGIGDGGCGGGAGGTIWLSVDSYSGNIICEAIGGNGSDSDGAAPINIERCFGPGGGGAGGLVWVKQAIAPAPVLTSLTGGINGVVSNSTAACLGDANGAESGNDGVVEVSTQEIDMSRIANKTCSLIPVFEFGNDTVLCEGETLELTIPNTGIYEWSGGETSQSITVSSEGTYIGQVDDGVCIIIDTITVTYELDQNSSTTINICSGVDTELSPFTAGSDHLWSTGETTETITINTEGTYTVSYTGEKCNLNNTIEVTMIALDEPFEDNLVVMCDYDGVVLNAKNPGSSYSWSTSETTRKITVTELGTYQVEITDDQNCTLTTNVTVVECEDGLVIPNTITPNGDRSNDFWIINNIYSYPNNEVKIYDKAGALLYEQVQYNNDWSGEGLPAGTYYYVLKLTESSIQKGSITIVRE